MGPNRSHNPLIDSMCRRASSPTGSSPQNQRQSSSSSSISQPSSPTSPRTSPKVQLIPHFRTRSFDVALTESQRALVDGTSFDHLDLSSQDFDFEDIFTYDKPQKKLPKVVEVTTRERDWSNFSFSHYTVAMTARAKVNRNRSGISEKYLKNQIAQTGPKKG